MSEFRFELKKTVQVKSIPKNLIGYESLEIIGRAEYTHNLMENQYLLDNEKLDDPVWVSESQIELID